MFFEKFAHKPNIILHQILSDTACKFYYELRTRVEIFASVFRLKNENISGTKTY